MYLHRRPETGFRPEKREKFVVANIWLDFVAWQRNINIVRHHTHGREVKILSHKLDGYCPETGEGFDFDGCW